MGSPPHVFAAFLAGLTCYMLGMCLTVYDGFLSLVCQPFIGALFTAIALIEAWLLGLPLILWDRAEVWWGRHPMVAQGIVAVSLALMGGSLLPAVQEPVIHPETNDVILLPNAYMAIAGWHGVIFGILHHPSVKPN